MMREGPFPAFLHGLTEYIGGALFIALPLLLDYESGAATAASIIIGVAVIAVAATTDWGLSLVNKIPKAAHLVLDFGLAALLIASPFLFGFSDEGAPTAIFIAAGVLHVLLTIGTRFVKDGDATHAGASDAAGRRDRGRGRGPARDERGSEGRDAATLEPAATQGDATAAPGGGATPMGGVPAGEEPTGNALAAEIPADDAPAGTGGRFARDSSGSDRITTAVSEEQQAATSARTGDRSTSRRDG